MKVLTRGVHLALTDDLKAYIDKHLVAPLERFVQNQEAAEIEVHLVDNNGPKGGVDKECRVTVRVPHFQAIHVEEAAETEYAAIDAVRDRLERATKRAFQKRRDPSLPEGPPGAP